MRCPKCFSEFAPGSTSCPKCGTILAETEQRAPEQAKSKPKWIFPVAGALAALIILALVFAWAMKGKSATNAQTPVPGPSVTNAPVPPPGPSVTNAVPAPPPQTQTVQCPQEVLDYLNFVKGIEQKRQNLLKDTSSALSMSTQSKGLGDMIDWVMDDSSKPVDPLADVKKELGTHVTNWQALLTEFEQKQSPQECADFATAYRQGLTSETSAIGKVAGIMSGINVNSNDSMQQALTALKQMKSDNLQGNIDSSVEAANTKLEDLCKHYNIAKPFDVKKESDSGGSLTGGF